MRCRKTRSRATRDIGRAWIILLEGRRRGTSCDGGRRRADRWRHVRHREGLSTGHRLRGAPRPRRGGHSMSATSHTSRGGAPISVQPRPASSPHRRRLGALGPPRRLRSVGLERLPHPEVRDRQRVDLARCRGIHAERRPRSGRQSGQVGARPNPSLKGLAPAQSARGRRGATGHPWPGRAPAFGQPRAASSPWPHGQVTGGLMAMEPPVSVARNTTSDPEGTL